MAEHGLNATSLSNQSFDGKQTQQTPEISFTCHLLLLLRRDRLFSLLGFCISQLAITPDQMSSSNHPSAMGNKPSDCVDNDEEETIADSFVCCVCL